MEKVKGVLKSQQGSICAEGGCRQPGARLVPPEQPWAAATELEMPRRTKLVLFTPVFLHYGGFCCLSWILLPTS